VSTQGAVVQIAHDFAMALARRNSLNRKLRDKLIAERPQRRDEILLLFSTKERGDTQATVTEATVTEAVDVNAPEELLKNLRTDPKAILHQIRIEHRFQVIPRGLADELSDVFRKLPQVERIVETAGQLLGEALPTRKKLSIADVVMHNTREAWESVIREATMISPQTLGAVFLAAHLQTENALPITFKTLQSLIEAKPE
jgi:hypothetical protein